MDHYHPANILTGFPSVYFLEPSSGPLGGLGPRQLGMVQFGNSVVHTNNLKDHIHVMIVVSIPWATCLNSPPH